MGKKDFNFDLKQIRSFMEVLSENSFTRASRKLKLGQATISHHIQQLEKMLGVTLVTRTSKNLSITRDGETFKAFCEQLFDDIEKLKVNLSEGMHGGITRICSSTIPSTYILPGIIAHLKKKYPDFFYKIDIFDSREVVEIIKEGKTEIGVVGKRFKHPALNFKKICTDEIVLIGSKDYPSSIYVKDIPALPMILRENGSGTRNACEKELKKHGIVPSELNGVFECSTSASIKESVITGIGVAFISKLAIERELRLEKVKIININKFKIVRDFFIVTFKNRHLSKPVRALIDELL